MLEKSVCNYLALAISFFENWGVFCSDPVTWDLTCFVLIEWKYTGEMGQWPPANTSLTLSCHFPFWQMRNTRRAGHPSDRWGAGLQLHQWCYRQWPRGTFFHFFFYCSGISAGWKTRLISAHSWRYLWEPSDHWLFHGMKSWLAAKKEELNQSQLLWINEWVLVTCGVLWLDCNCKL